MVQSEAPVRVLVYEGVFESTELVDRHLYDETSKVVDFHEKADDTWSGFVGDYLRKMWNTFGYYLLGIGGLVYLLSGKAFEPLWQTVGMIVSATFEILSPYLIDPVMRLVTLLSGLSEDIFNFSKPLENGKAPGGGDLKKWIEDHTEEGSLAYRLFFGTRKLVYTMDRTIDVGSEFLREVSLAMLEFVMGLGELALEMAPLLTAGGGGMTGVISRLYLREQLMRLINRLLARNADEVPKTAYQVVTSTFKTKVRNALTSIAEKFATRFKPFISLVRQANNVLGLLARASVGVPIYLLQKAGEGLGRVGRAAGRGAVSGGKAAATGLIRILRNKGPHAIPMAVMKLRGFLQASADVLKGAMKWLSDFVSGLKGKASEVLSSLRKSLKGLYDNVARRISMRAGAWNMAIKNFAKKFANNVARLIGSVANSKLVAKLAGMVTSSSLFSSIKSWRRGKLAKTALEGLGKTKVVAKALGRLGRRASRYSVKMVLKKLIPVLDLAVLGHDIFKASTSDPLSGPFATHAAALFKSTLYAIDAAFVGARYGAIAGTALGGPVGTVVGGTVGAIAAVPVGLQLGYKDVFGEYYTWEGGKPDIRWQQYEQDWWHKRTQKYHQTMVDSYREDKERTKEEIAQSLVRRGLVPPGTQFSSITIKDGHAETKLV